MARASESVIVLCPATAETVAATLHLRILPAVPPSFDSAPSSHSATLSTRASDDKAGRPTSFPKDDQGLIGAPV
ncbi:hypothetical protein MRX96_005019 [Rhipicephalus microplus]